jgi:predicted ester cyclase
VTVIDRVARFQEIWDGVWHSPGAASVIAESYTDDFRMHISSLAEPIDRTAFVSFVAGWQRAFPNGRMEIIDRIADGDRVWCYWLSTGTHRAEYLGIPETGRQVAYAGVDIYRFEGTRIAECWAVPDVLTLLRQLGVASR